MVTPNEPASDTAATVAYRAAWTVRDGETVSDPYFEVDSDGTIVATTPGGGAGIVHDLGQVLLLPGLVNAHSHAFQRAIRGATQARGAADPSSFWSWREAMYREAARLDPEGVYRVTKRAYTEMVRAGITCVGEFHYLHHQPDGRPYDDPNELSLQVARAAEDAGIGLVLLGVYYSRSAPGQPPRPEQRRFCDGSVDRYLGRMDDLRTRGLAIGIAPHSVRAVRVEELRELAAYATAQDLVMHAHVSEQPAENEACQAEHGRSPTQVLADAGCLSHTRRFTAVHAVFLEPEDPALLADQIVCACPTTEADLGDGIVPATTLRQAGAGLALGSDSNAVIDLIQEARLLEMGERLRTGQRLCLADDRGRVGATLLECATHWGAAAVGREDSTLAVGRAFDACTVDLGHPMLADVEATNVLDALLLSGTAAPIDRVFVGGRRVA